MNKERKTKKYPTKPVKPDTEECCNRNCENCVYDYYERALQRWNETANK